MKKVIYISFITILVFFGCKENISESPVSSNYSGQYENSFYNDGSIEPEVTLVLSQDSDELSGLGFFNGISFNLSGKIDGNHAVITFDLLNTNYGNLKGCKIDGFFGTDNSLSGGYTLIPSMGTQKIRFNFIGQVN